jgi:antitoxin FitA
LLYWTDLAYQRTDVAANRLTARCGIGCHSQAQRECDQALLGTVVQVAFDPAASLIGRGHDPRPRRDQLSSALGIGHRNPNELGEIGHPLFDIRQPIIGCLPRRLETTTATSENTCGRHRRLGAAFQLHRCYYDCMVAVTIRDVPDGVRDELAARAARAGKSLQEYLRGLLVEAADKPTVEEVLARARARVTATGARVDAATTLAARDADRR